MSGPYCKTCKHYQQTPLGDPEQGVCNDPSKIIYDRNGNDVNSEPAVHEMYSCNNHESNAETQPTS